MWLFIPGSGEVLTADLLSLAGDAGDAYASVFASHLSNAWGLDSVEVVFQVGAGDAISATSEVSHVGSITSDVMPANVALCISWTIAASYRGGHARTYLCGIPSTDAATVSTWNTSYAGVIAAGANTLHTDLEALTYGSIPSVEHGIVSFVHAGAWRSPPIFRRIVAEGAHVDLRIDTQRRRLGKDVS